APEDAFTSDRLLVELILQNLMDNAVKFTPAGGRVACSIRRQGQAIRITVSDTGPGIRREDQPRVFERFFQADASRQRADGSRGTGLGLAIVKHACERLGGSVSLESELGKGTAVTVVVPDQTRQ
ncbi:MAG: ATP-binding protein, partial [Planctomycetota bacterium]|nr:ATP-binding protein [Planctomycetota bacterium]